jgi:hypothetical protein
MDGNELVIGSFLNVRGDFTRKRQVENFGSPSGLLAF